MWRVRPAKLDDLQQILDIAGAQIARLSSTLPKTEENLARKIEHSWASLAAKAPSGTSRCFLFVLENTDTARLPEPQVSTAGQAMVSRSTTIGETTLSMHPMSSTFHVGLKCFTRATHSQT